MFKKMKVFLLLFLSIWFVQAKHLVPLKLQTKQDMKLLHKNIQNNCVPLTSMVVGTDIRRCSEVTVLPHNDTHFLRLPHLENAEYLVENFLRVAVWNNLIYHFKDVNDVSEIVDLLKKVYAN